MKKREEIKSMTDEQLKNLVEDLEKELFELKNHLATTKKLEKPHLIKEKKKQKARALTLLSERKNR